MCRGGEGALERPFCPLRGRSCLCQPAGPFHHNSCFTHAWQSLHQPPSPASPVSFSPSPKQGANVRSAILYQLSIKRQGWVKHLKLPWIWTSTSRVWRASYLLGIHTCEREGRRQDGTREVKRSKPCKAPASPARSSGESAAWRDPSTSAQMAKPLNPSLSHRTQASPGKGVTSGHRLLAVKADRKEPGVAGSLPATLPTPGSEPFTEGVSGPPLVLSTTTDV